jgi:NAD(P)H-flavin reductase
LQRLGFAPGDVLVSMELKMQCGVGRCGRCNIGGKYVCRDGPVFSLAELGELPEEY